MFLDLLVRISRCFVPLARLVPSAFLLLKIKLSGPPKFVLEEIQDGIAGLDADVILYLFPGQEAI